MARLIDLLSQTLSIAAILGIVAYAAGPAAQAQTASQTAPPIATPEMQAAIDTCRPDIERLCPGVAPGDGRIMACMREHRAEITPACRSAALAAAAVGGGAGGGTAGAVPGGGS